MNVEQQVPAKKFNNTLLRSTRLSAKLTCLAVMISLLSAAAFAQTGGAGSGGPAISGSGQSAAGPAAQPQAATDQDCEKIKEEIKALQDSLSELSVSRQRIANALDRINKDVAVLQQGVKFFSGPGFSETARGEALDKLAKAMGERQRVEQELEDVDDLIQSVKDAIADLLSKLGSCGPPSATQPVKQEALTQPTPPSKPSPSESQTSSKNTGGTGVQFQLRGFGGASFINGNTPATSGFDGAVLFPLGNRVLVGPAAGFQWVDSSIVKTIGGGTPPSTFLHESAGFKQGNFGGVIAFPFSHTGGGWSLTSRSSPTIEIVIHAGATVANSTITQAEGFCGSGGPTAPAGCQTVSSTTAHDTTTGPFVGGYISHSIFSHVGIFVGYDYHLLKDTKSSTTVFDLHSSDVVAGFTFTFGRHPAK